MHQQDGDRRGRDAGDARGLSHRGGTNLLELLPHFVREPADARVVEVRGQARFLVAALARDLFFLALDVARVFRGDLELHADLRRAADRLPRFGIGADELDHVFVATLRAGAAGRMR